MTRHVALLVALVAAFGRLLAVDARQRVPSMPRNVDVTQINVSSIRVAWQTPENEGASPIFGYNVYKDRHAVGGGPSAGLHKAVASVDRNKLYTFIDDLEPNSEYVIRVAAFNEYGDGERSPVRRIITGGRPPSAPRPQSIQPSPTEANGDSGKTLRARVEWLSPARTYGLPVLKYVLRHRPVELSTAESVELDAGQNAYVIDNLHHGQLYELQIGALNEAGLSDYATEQFVTPEAAPDGEPLNVRYTIVKNQAGTTLSVLWDPPLWMRRNGNITQYRVVFRAQQGRNAGQTIEQNVTAQSAAFEVDARTSYTFKVAAATAKGYGPYSPTLTINANINTSIGPPANVRVQALTNASVVVQWDFDEVANDGYADGFVVKYMHEPSAATGGSESERGRAKIYAQEKWRSQPVMDSKARYLEIGRLLPQKSYAFCVLAVKQSRLGPCSDPPVTLDRLRPVFVVQNLHVQYKTSQSVAFQWEYTGPTTNIDFYIRHSGVKTYQDQFLEEKHLESPGFEKRIDNSERQFLWQNLRPYMNYTFQVGVHSLDDGRMYWPRELRVQTNPTGPPFVDPPEFIQSPSSTTAHIRLNCASEEYGPLDHYWLIVVPANYTKEDVVNVDSIHLQHSTARMRALRDSGRRPSSPTGGESTLVAVAAVDDSSPESSSRRLRREPRAAIARSLEGVYISAQLSTHYLQRLYRKEHTFTLGDGKEYDGYLNLPLDPNGRYSLMMRAFTHDDKFRHFEHPFEQRPPMQEPASRLFTDSILTEPFSTRTSLFGDGASTARGAPGSIVWLAGPAVVIFVLALIVGMLVAWWWRSNARNRAKFRGANTPHGVGVGGVPMTKVALSASDFHSPANSGVGVGMPANLSSVAANETSKLLLGMDADGRPIINAYEQRPPVLPALSDSSAILNHLHHPAFADGGSGGAVATLKQNGTAAYVSAGGGTLAPAGAASVRYMKAQPMLADAGMSADAGGSTLIPLTEFATHIDRLKMNNNALFSQEFESIETGKHFTWQNSSLDVNKHKNRYANVVAYDHSRVILMPLEDAGGAAIAGSDYINANYIDGYDVPRAYIATQGPLPETFADFWRMVWEERSATIVMLTRLEERQRTKCDQYWPSRGSSIYGFFRVALLDTTQLAHYCIRTMRVEDTRTREHRDIQHAQFTAWPDHGVPHHPTPFLIFLKRVKALNPPGAGPIVTHCSAGVGRTGAFIVIDCMLDRLRYEMTVDIYGCVKAVRAQRSYMVQTDEQYVFIHDAVLDAAQSGSTEVPTGRLAQHIQVLTHQRQIDDATGMEIEFGTLVTLRTPDPKCLAASQPCNLAKNRQPDVLPYDWNRVELMPIDGVEGADYINASWIDGYRSRDEYIATQAPLPNTTADFWRMVWERECCIIAMLAQTTRGSTDACHVYWPAERRETIGRLIIDCVSEFDMTHYVLREFRLTHSEAGKSRTVRQFHFLEWPACDVPYYVDRFVDYVRQIHQTKTQFGAEGPICVHCSDGAGRTGVFVTASAVIERIKLERCVDIFTTVKLLRMQRPNMVETREQYEFCYKAAVQFLSSFEEPL